MVTIGLIVLAAQWINVDGAHAVTGTIARGSNALEDAARVKALLFNPKEESELTMCTDVDRNDKSRICEPGSVRVLGRRQIEMYSRYVMSI